MASMLATKKKSASLPILVALTLHIWLATLSFWIAQCYVCLHLAGEKSQFLRLKSSEICISSWLTHAKSFFPMVDPSNPHRFFLPPGPTRVMKQPRDARVAVGGWRLFDLVVQVNEFALTTFVPGDTLGKPRKLMGKNRKHVGAERE